MSSVPPNLVGPLLQSHLMQRQVSRVRDTESAQQASATRAQGAAAEEVDTTVETTDDDTQIHSDAEGTGSQGRAFDDGAPEEQQPDNTAPPDDDGGHILDIQA